MRRGIPRAWRWLLGIRTMLSGTSTLSLRRSLLRVIRGYSSEEWNIGSVRSAKRGYRSGGFRYWLLYRIGLPWEFVLLDDNVNI